MSVTNTNDLALDLPLRGVQLIEASAGTGKTHTLAGIYTRLIVEGKFRVRQILVVTFTRAATEELKSRLRARLVLCAEVATGLYHDVAAPSAELAQSRVLVEQALQIETAPLLQRRLHLAALELDTAQISTIHGFCQRALREHAFFAGAAVDGELVASDHDLLETVAQDLWRKHAVAADVESFTAFAAVVCGAKSFVRLLPRLLDVEQDLLPRAELDEAQARAALRTAAIAGKTLADAWNKHGAQAFAALHAHAQAGNINATSYPLKKIQIEAQKFSCAFANGEIPELDLLRRYATTALDAKRKKDKPTLPAQVFFEEVSSALDVLLRAQSARHELGMYVLRTTIEEARRRRDAIKHLARRFCYDDLIRHLHDALRGPHASALAQALHAQYPCALVDEFQDTDTRQFAIFETIYRDRGSLVLIGDPKQAIYRFRGGDIHAYLAARARADGVYSLSTNFRSTPGYLAALERLYTFSGAAPFADERIRFEHVRCGDTAADDDLLIDGKPAMPLTLWRANDDGSGRGDAVRRLAQGCATAILGLLNLARDGRARLRTTLAHGERDYRALEPRDLAVLVNEHKEAEAMCAALSTLRIPAVCVSKRSVFASDEARELHVLLDALVELDEMRLRSALTTVLFGDTLTDFVGLSITPDARRNYLAKFAQLQRTWIEQGVLAMLERVFEQRAPGLLALEFGERRMTNWLQLADLAQTASAQVFGLRGLVDWLAQRIARADDENEDEQLRLESDADRVQVRTIHASKGLEYPIVFLPFATLRRGEHNAYPKLLRYQDLHGRSGAYLVTDKVAAESPAAQSARASESDEDLAERLRVLYVGFTRARQACFVAAGIFGDGGRPSPLLHLLDVNNEKAAASASLSQRLTDLLGHHQSKPMAIGPDETESDAVEGAPETIALVTLPEPDNQRLRSPATPALGAARQATRKIVHGHDLYSFSRLSAGVHAETSVSVERAGNDDEQGNSASMEMNPAINVPAVLRGARFGTAFHEILEKADFAAWRDWHAAAPPTQQRALIEGSLLRYALIGAHDDAERAIRRTVTELVATTLNAPLPFGARLCDLAPNQYRAEMPFHFAIDNADAQRWLESMQDHGYLQERTHFNLQAQRLAGLMTGVLDLVVFYHARFWVIDYKTNLLGVHPEDYAPTRLVHAVRKGEYDLQYLIYLVALHRWLKTRLGASYDYSRDVGGALYLFVRGLDAQGVNGIHHDRPPLALIESLDNLLAAAPEAAA